MASVCLKRPADSVAFFDLSILGALEVATNRDIANWGRRNDAIGRSCRGDEAEGTVNRFRLPRHLDGYDV